MPQDQLPVPASNANKALQPPPAPAATPGASTAPAPTPLQTPAPGPAGARSPADMQSLFGHMTDPAVPGVDQKGMVFGPQASAQQLGPLAPKPSAVPDTTIPTIKDSPKPQGGLVNTVKNVVTGNQSMGPGSDFKFGATPTTSTSGDHDKMDSMNRDRVEQKQNDAAAAKANNIDGPGSH